MLNYKYALNLHWKFLTIKQGIASFHPASKDSLCGAHGWRNGSLHLFTYIAKSNKGSTEMTNHTSWSRLCTCVENGWWKWNTPFMNLSLLYLDNMRTWLYICIYFCSWTFMCLIIFNTRTFMCPYFFGSCFLGMLFFYSPCLI